jgi:Trk K+ transport system NAD-binding subunit
VCGVGHLGTRVVKHLLAQGFDVVVIESNPNASGIEEMRSYGIPLILKDARHLAVLQDAGVERADTLLVCTDDDMANLAVVMHARELNPAMRIVVRMFNDSLAAQVREKLGADAVYSASMLAAPVFASAATRTEVAQTYTVGDELFSMARLEVCEGSPLAGQMIAQIEQPKRLDVVLHISGEEAAAHPNADAVVRAGDELVIFAREDLLREIANLNRVPNC